MAKRKLSPLVQAMNIFNEMDERDKVTLAEYIKSQMATSRKTGPKSTAPSAGRQSSRRGAGNLSTANTEGDKGSASSASNLPDNPEDFKFGATA